MARLSVLTAAHTLKNPGAIAFFKFRVVDFDLELENSPEQMLVSVDRDHGSGHTFCLTDELKDFPYNPSRGALLIDDGGDERLRAAKHPRYV